MQKYIAAIPAALLVVIPVAASAHQHASYEINGKQYDIVIGSLNEPIVVDDKTGLDLRVTSGGRMEMADDGDMEPVGGSPEAGLETKLKVEMIAGDSKKTFEISPVFNAPGSYKTMFYPTVATTFSYRLFGEINDTPVDLTFTCRAEGETATEEGEKEISAGVKQLLKGGGFGCPMQKADQGFPEASVALTDVGGGSSNSIAFGAAALALAALAFSFSRRK